MEFELDESIPEELADDMFVCGHVRDKHLAKQGRCRDCQSKPQPCEEFRRKYDPID